jgi:biopolymer transport protein ExbB/TolQ
MQSPLHNNRRDPLIWSREDFEERTYGSGGRYTRVNTFRSGIVAAALSVLFYLALMPIEPTPLTRLFTDQGSIQYFTVFFTFWSMVILFVKWQKLRLQVRVLGEDYRIVPSDSDFVLAKGNVDDVLRQMSDIVHEPKHFLLMNRIHIALSNLRNIGRIADVDGILRSQAEHDESAMETSYALVSSFVWAIPVLGFIGTVVGLSAAIGSFGSVLQGEGALEDIKASLQNVTAGLSTAFETTLLALVAALFIQLILALLKKSEEEFLDACAEYCVRHVVNRLRVTDIDSGAVQE